MKRESVELTTPDGIDVVEAVPKKTRNAAATKLKIQEAAEAEFASKGFDGARLATIAKAAGVQQALIHHYFSDKAGLYREVIARALGAMSAEGWTILQRLARPENKPQLRELTTAFVGMMLDFFEAHGAFLSILRHESTATDEVSLKVIRDNAKPVFDAMIAYIETMKQRGEIRADVDAHHVCVSALSLASVSAQDERLLQAMWEIDLHSPEFLLKRKQEIVETILSRVEIRGPVKKTAARKNQGSGGTLDRTSARFSRRRRG